MTPPSDAEPGPAASAPEEALSDAVRELFCALRHTGDAGEGHWSCGEAGSERQGTRVRFALHLEGQRILEARYRAYGCPHTLATCEWLAIELPGRVLAAPSAAALTRAVGGPLDWADRLAIPAAKLGRLLIIEDALRGAVEGDVFHFDPAVTKGA